MKNSNFIVEIDTQTGFVTSITNPQDENNMNWCSDTGNWGAIQTTWQNFSSEQNKDVYWPAEEALVLNNLEISDTKMSAVYINKKLNVTVNRFFNSNNNLTEQIIIKNITDCVVCVNRDNFGIELPFNDKYTFADECMTNRCNTHIWCGYNTSWVNALKMGKSEINLGLIVTKGSFVSYRQSNCGHSKRGSFIFEPETILLKNNEEYIIEWEMFWHSGKKDFGDKLASYESYIGIEAKYFTVFEDEKIEFKIIPHNSEKPVVTCMGETVVVTEINGGFYVSYTPKNCGEHKFIIECGNLTTFTEFMVKLPFAKLAEKRLHFIADNQQCLDKESPLYGAYLIYDNKISSPYFDSFISDHNACRERLNMPFAIIRYLQHHDDKKLRDSIDLYIDFVFREFYEEETGEVFNNIGKSRNAVRLYNAPGPMLIFAEMYYLTKDDKYLDNILKLAEKYYSIGGEKCYSNGIAIRKIIEAFKLSGREDDTYKMLDFFHLHVNNMLKNGTSYPKHEVNYEQTIVTPVVNCISEIGLYCENKEFYIDNATKHLACLDSFSGNQPSFHLDEIAIRYWDDFWFGKSHLYGDTLPHHLSCLTARAFISYSRLTGDKTYVERAEKCIRNCLCLIGDNGHGSAAYVYPHMVNNMKGEFYDEWANDQDLVLYEGMSLCGISEAFSL